ncbi:MAG TPA: hypothetical protein VKE74_18250 [Gemmataceae bacterium]|nr:hypothetical protein [Gemmataceae bacterium]
MPIVRIVRPFVCLLLAVSTALGTVTAPVRACECGARSRGFDGPREVPAVAGVPVVAEPAACHRCCPPGTVKAACCCRETTNTPPSRAADSGLPGCQCARCECEGPPAPPAVPAPTGDQLSAQATPIADAALVPPAFLPLPAADRTGRVELLHHHPPGTLVISTSRLNC